RSKCRKPEDAMKATVNKVKLYPMWMNTQRATDFVTARMAVSAVPTPNRISNGAQACANCSEGSRAKPAAGTAVAGGTPKRRGMGGIEEAGEKEVFRQWGDEDSKPGQHVSRGRRAKVLIDGQRLRDPALQRQRKQLRGKREANAPG